MIQISYVVTTDETAEKVFNFFCSLDKHYLKLSKGHKKFELINADLLAKGVFVANEEMVSGQYIKHKYQVVDIIKNRYIKLVSDQSVVTILKIFKFLLKVTVEFEIEPFKDGKTNVSSHLTLEFRNKTHEFFALMMNIRHIWKNHLKEEMENGLKIIESQ